MAKFAKRDFFASTQLSSFRVNRKFAKLTFVLPMQFLFDGSRSICCGPSNFQVAQNLLLFFPYQHTRRVRSDALNQCLPYPPTKVGCFSNSKSFSCYSGAANFINAFTGRDFSPSVSNERIDSFPRMPIAPL